MWSRALGAGDALPFPRLPCCSPAASGDVPVPFPEEEIVSMADSTTTIDDIEGELFRIERIREILVRRESELRYM